MPSVSAMPFVTFVTARALRFAAVAAVLGVLVGAPGAASANVAKASRGGTPNGEPEGIRDVAIRHEELVIDLRPIADHRFATVVATYHLDNRGPEVSLDLVFAGGSEQLDELAAALDGRPAATAVHTAPLPASWHAPRTTPSADGDGDDLPFGLDHEAARGFTLVVPPGLHKLEVSYLADAVHDRVHELAIRHQFAYVLAPARAWDGFGGLDVTMRLPAGWAAGVTPAMSRTGDTLHASFDHLPADAIGVTIHAPEGFASALGFLAKLVLAMIGLGGGFLVRAWAAAHERRRALAGQWPSRLLALGRGLTWSAAFFTAGMIAIFWPGSMLPSGEADHHGYGEAFAAIGVFLAAMVMLVIGAWVAWRAGRRVHLEVARV